MIWPISSLIIIFLILFYASKKNYIKSTTLKTWADIATVVSFIAVITFWLFDHFNSEINPSNTKIIPSPTISTNVIVEPLAIVEEEPLAEVDAIKETPITVVNNYFEYLNSKNIQAAWDLFTDEFKISGPDKKFDNFYDYWYYKIKKCNVISTEELSRDNREAIVRVEITYINSVDQETGKYILDYYLEPTTALSKWKITNVVTIQQP